MSDPDFDSFPLVTHGNRYDDFTVGQRLPHRWGRTVTAGDNTLFSTATCHWSPLYLDADYARAQGHPDMVVNPWLVLATVVGLSVEDTSESGGGPFLGIDECRFLAPVYPGDTLTAESEVVDKRQSASRAGWGIVTWRTTGRNQHGVDVLELRRSNLSALAEGTTL